MLGWLDRDGTFYSCHSYEHYEAAQRVFGLSDWQLEERGIVKVYLHHTPSQLYKRRGTDEEYYIQSPNRLTNAQYNWLIENDFNVDEDDTPL